MASFQQPECDLPPKSFMTRRSQVFIKRSRTGKQLSDGTPRLAAQPEGRWEEPASIYQPEGRWEESASIWTTPTLA